MMEALQSDRLLGMELYATDSPGCGGRLRTESSDFVVEEIYEGQSYEGGRYLVVEVEKVNWETHHLVRDLSRQLQISQKRFGWAGTKDKKAVTRQRMSIMALEEEALRRVALPGVKIRVLGRSNRGVSLGDLRGNRFAVRIREVDLDDREAARRVATVTEEIEDLGGLPNYFGVQRFGEVRPVTHLVGEALVRGEPERAAMTYLAHPFPGEPQDTREARGRLLADRDFAAALKEYPLRLRYERAMMARLQEERDFARSFDVLATNLKRLFVHAYQSLLFNRILSRRMRSGLPLDRAVEGDVVCFSKGGLPDVDKIQAVDKSNLDAVSRLAERGRAFVTLPLLGHSSALADGLPGEIERSVLEEEGVDLSDFRVEANPDLGSPGSRRPALLRVEPIAQIEGGACVLLNFDLPAGSYATVVLREYMKPAEGGGLG
ncbi:tRNA pseudouridine(13) synthase TruD [Candidatus Methanocrinis natronophilus]|uniref:Probable tRNA pseudouridine synthase D n=1 Tax=Candidatus Methanocrinis natronophilus TaxID=3033396 RepID=A0ABT5X5Z9_9EURY|nr:tRNA pseudouridine(13) synthase TruD [Candidatus Methanocrinis natronophilus]MDF0590121.1 tRNA pseudouridine(13) synthase TruD [Candidatus Methanocrinis natronophilus]